MLKSGKLKLADDMIVTAQEAVNKAETVFTIYDDKTNTEIAKGPIGGGGGGGDVYGVKIERTNTVNENTVEFGATITTNIRTAPSAPYNIMSVYLLADMWMAVSMDENVGKNYNFVVNGTSYSASYANGKYTANVNTSDPIPIQDAVNITFAEQK